ncbi:MAG: putative 3-hydroxybutyryl-CoA dehydrogenase [Candidatus Lokiarchaeum sp. GC14_75]|nr:MAG: putative 3-hydroxybutyryl-CoA dehydrogenase [Candidatus Lokiarchaeum sp. GC14_75]
MVEIKNVVVVGAGQMGNGIAQMSLLAGYNVTLVDITDDFVGKGWNKIDVGMKKLESKGTLPEGSTAASLMEKCKKSTNIASAVKDADIMIEAVIEKMDVKKQVFKTAGDNAPSHCVLASNTSTMSITEMSKDSGRPDKCIGMHFFNPVPLMRLIEVIYSDHSSDESVNIGIEFAESIPCLRGKRYVAKVLKDKPGFICNRVTAPAQIYQNYVFDKALDEGFTWDQLDNDSRGGPMSMTVLADYVGIDTLYHGQIYYSQTLSPDFAPGKVISQLFNEGKLGAKTGQGFRDWSKGRPKPDKTAGKAKLYNLKFPLAIMVNEACRVLEEGITTTYKIIDDTLMAGMNMPGPMAANVKTWQNQVKVLEELVELTRKEYFKPCELLTSGKWVEYI